MNIVVVTGSGRAPAWVEPACTEWAGRISRQFPLRFSESTPKLGPRARVVVLDERGEERSSEGMSDLLEEAIRQAAQPLVFVIGGPYGVEPEVAAAAWKTLRLSRMVLNHCVARVVLVEQLYRACSIRSGSPYHHG